MTIGYLKKKWNHTSLKKCARSTYIIDEVYDLKAKFTNLLSPLGEKSTTFSLDFLVLSLLWW